MNSAAELEAAEAAPRRRFGAGPYGVVVILLTASVLSFLDRAILGLMVDPLRHDLKIGDAQIGLLSGFAFSLFYALLERVEIRRHSLSF